MFMGATGNTFAAVYKRFNTTCSFGLVAVLLERGPAPRLSPRTLLAYLKLRRLPPHLCLLCVLMWPLCHFSCAFTTVSQWKGTFWLTDLTKARIKSQKYSSKSKPWGISLYGFFSFYFQMTCTTRDWGTRCLHAAVQRYQCGSAQLQEKKTSPCLISVQSWPAPDTTFPLYSWSQFTQGLLRVVPVLHPQSLLAGHTVTVQRQQLVSGQRHITLSHSTHICSN